MSILGSSLRATSKKSERNTIASGLKRSSDSRVAMPTSGAGEEEWMITYTDLVTLMLTLFVILISLATFEDPGDAPEEVPGIMEGTESVIEVPDPTFGVTDPPEPEVEAPEDLRETLTDEQLERVAELEAWSERVANMLQYHLQSNALLDGIEIQIVNYQVVIQMRDRILFPSGSADLAVAGRGVIEKMQTALEFVDSRIDVEGHTDNLPISSALYPSNWELSTARAAAVVRHLVGSGMPPDRLRAVGFADTQPQASNDTIEGRAKNRRVSLVVVPDVDVETGRLVEALTPARN